MRRDDKPVGPRLQAPHVVEAGHLLRSVREVEQQDVFSANGAFDAANQDNAAFAAVGHEIADVKLTVVERDSQRRISERRRPIDQRAGIVGN